jgi:hypothetical protein
MSEEPENVAAQVTTQSTVQVSPALLVNRRAPDFHAIYTNNSKFSVSPFDFSVILNEVTESEKGEVYVEQKARIIMPPLHAKLFALVLIQNVQNFEKEFGEITIPDNIFTMPVMPSVEAKAPEAAPPQAEEKPK